MRWPEWMIYQIPAAASDGFRSRRPNALRDGARQVLAAITGTALLGPKTGVVWRGHADVSWRLESKASRERLGAAEVAEREQEMLREARRLGVDGAQRMGDWEILARLRHHGAITRLIDATTDPFIALWFLCEDGSAPEREADGLLLAIQRSAFTEIQQPYRADSYREMLDKPPAALIYSTPPIDPRIAAQRGLFLLRSSPLPAEASPASELGEIVPPSKAWETKHQEYLSRLCGSSPLAEDIGRPQFAIPAMLGILVPAPVKPVLAEMLRQNFGFSRSSIFPDFAGLGEVYSGSLGSSI
jgi:FRG domain.